MHFLEQAEQAAQVLSQQRYQDHACWLVELSYSKTFEDGEVSEQSQSLQVVAVLGGINHIRLSLEEAVLAAANQTS
ncbi:MAG: hypothetical protein ICV62_07165 [Cyanobacteria bacterium Co-bin13]|nr:hypothetical protein [Cyanobacteria bacterium Co-bin13]